MTLLKFLLVSFISFFFLVSCQKETSIELGLSEGTLKKDATGNCLPSTVNGIFKEDSLLKLINYIEIQINVTETGTYIIKSDTVNGYSFYGGGTLDVVGLNTVRLQANGRPTDPGINTFTINFDTTSCKIDVPVVTIGPPATYTLGTGGNCTGVTPNGIYMVSVPLIPSNTVTVDVDVTVIGSYELTTNTVNGISFTAIGEFTTIGAQTVTLNPNIGTPAASGIFNYTITGNTPTITCNFPLTISAPPSAAVFTFGGAGGTCTGVSVLGTYTQGVTLNGTQTVTLDVNVTTVGTYSISTTLANGVTFLKLGLFTAIGPQSVTLTGGGTPTAAGNITHQISGTGGCSFQVTYL